MITGPARDDVTIFETLTRRPDGLGGPLVLVEAYTAPFQSTDGLRLTLELGRYDVDFYKHCDESGWRLSVFVCKTDDSDCDCCVAIDISADRVYLRIAYRLPASRPGRDRFELAVPFTSTVKD